jgi:hypothetical protein
MENQKAKISKFSKAICVGITIALVVYIIVLVLQVTSWVIATWNLPYIFKFRDVEIALPTVFVLNDVSVDLPPGLVGTLNDLMPEFFWGSFAGVLQTVVTIVILKFSKAFFKLLCVDGSPFRSEVVSALRKTAIALLALGVISGLTGWVAAGIAYVLSLAFDYGCTLQNESDATL